MQKTEDKALRGLGSSSPRSRTFGFSVKTLCVDLDGTLLATDTLWEAVLALLKQSPFLLVLLPCWLLRGRAFLKQQVAQRIKLNVTLLPYQSEVMEFLRQEQRKGRKLVLVTAADRTIAEQIAQHTGLFTEVLASDGKVNLSGLAKLQALKNRYGEQGFDYMGNASVDRLIWRHADKAILVHPSWRLLKKTNRIAALGHVFERERTNRLVLFLTAIRVHQCIKNLLLFVPLFLAHQVIEVALLIKAGVAFVAFSFCASGVYVLNDLLDLEADRAHPQKRHRPFAAGELGIPTGILLCILLLLSSLTIGALLLPMRFIALLALYVVITTTYSMYLKCFVAIDAIVLAGLYTLRLFAGAVAVGVPISQWMLAFSMFLFVSLAFVKRCSELHVVRTHNEEAAKGRGYRAADLELLGNLGTASGYISVLVLALYIHGTEVMKLYSNPDRLWLACPLLLYWISRIWLIAHRGGMHDDPIVFTLKDKVSYTIGLGLALVIVLAL